MAQWPNTVLLHRFVSIPEPALVHAYSPTQGPPSRGRQVFSASGKFGGLPRPAPTVRRGGCNRRQATVRCRPPAPPERSSGRESAGQFHKKLLPGLPSSWGGARQWERSADDWPGDPPRAAGLLSAMHGSQPLGWETRYRSLCRLGGFLFQWNPLIGSD